jgi:hypothetical protein
MNDYIFYDFIWDVSNKELKMSTNSNLESFDFLLNGIIEEWLSSYTKKNHYSLENYSFHIDTNVIFDSILNKEAILLKMPRSLFQDFKILLHTKGFSSPKIYTSDLEKAKEVQNSLKVKKFLKLKYGEFSIGNIVIANEEFTNKNYSTPKTKSAQILKVLKNKEYAVREVGIYDILVETENGQAAWFQKQIFILKND